MKNTDRVIIKRNLIKQWLYIITCGVFLLIFLSFFTVDISDTVDVFTTFFSTIGIIGTSIFGYFTITLLRSSFRPLMVIDGEGFVETGRFICFVPWSNVANICEAGSNSKWFRLRNRNRGKVEIELIDATEFLNSLSRFRRLLVGRSLSIRKPKIYISLRFTAVSDVNIVDDMNRYYNIYQTTVGGYNALEKIDNIVDNLDRVVFARSFFKGFIAIVVVSIFITFFVIAMLITGIPKGVFSSLVILFFGFLTFILGRIAINLIRKILYKIPVLVIDRDGFTDYTNKRAVILWSDVEGIDVVTRTSRSTDSDGKRSTTYSTTIDIKRIGIDKLLKLSLSFAKETEEEIADIMVIYYEAYKKEKDVKKEDINPHNYSSTYEYDINDFGKSNEKKLGIDTIVDTEINIEPALKIILVSEAEPDKMNIIEYACDCDIEKVKECVANGEDINSIDGYGQTALFFASVNGELEIVSYLVENGIAINHVNHGGDIALIFASEAGVLDVVQYLYDQGADIHHKNHNGYTALDVAKERNNDDIVEFLESVNK